MLNNLKFQPGQEIGLIHNMRLKFHSLITMANLKYGLNYYFSGCTTVYGIPQD